MAVPSFVAGEISLPPLKTLTEPEPVTNVFCFVGFGAGFDAGFGLDCLP